MECLDTEKNSPNLYHKEYMENSDENIYTDIGA